jgi:hypothetical protein
MTTLRIASGKTSTMKLPPATCLMPLINQDDLQVEGGAVYHYWKNETGDRFFLFGSIIGLRQVDGALLPASLIKVEPERVEDPKRIPDVEGRFVVVKISAKGICDVWTDRFGRLDIYWQEVDGGVVLATSLDLLPVSQNGASSNSIGAAHALTVYGSRPAKQHTLYRGVHRLGVDKGIRLIGASYEILSRAFKAAEARPYGEKDLERYTDIFLEALRARASNDGNVVYLSSGWDSTSILAGLVHLFGNRKVRTVIGRMQYADRSGVINQFEMDRARAVADYFGVKLDIVELDYRHDAPAILERLQDLFRGQQFASLTGFNHWLLAEGVAKTSSGNETIFAGEMSDGAHNLGFSQYVSIFHPASQDFREYSDKMASYLFGPTFLGQLQSGAFEQDPVWQLYRQRNSTAKFDPPESGEKAVVLQLLSSFFLRSGRMPLYSIDNSRMLSLHGCRIFVSESEQIYLKEASEHVTRDNLYAWYLHLYNSFHWQGATVSTLEHTAHAHGFNCVSPFHDGALIDFLSAMPENFGRGLDLNPTKYPLKWMLRNRIDYPIHLQVGPHSYTYDVNPTFSLLGEILHASSFRGIFTNTLRAGRFVEWLEADVFDRSYIDGIVKRYLNGEELRGQEMKDVSVLAMHSMIGVYG